ncbi:MAG: transposase [Acidimicrobiia bacterium]|jgi:transposase|nr:transposase [Acidimicrobiia bacterium]
MSSSSRPRRRFTPEFKAEAVAMVESSGGQIAKVAKELGIFESSLGNWVRRAREEAAGAPSAAERAEIRDLRRELERVTRERDILGKAVAYFSAQHPKNG